MKNTIYTFPSGLRLVYKNLSNVRSVGISVLTAVGSNNESVELNGISHFIEHVFFKGTSKRNSFEIVEYVDGIGAQINAYTSKQCTCFYTLSIDDKAEECCEVLSDLMFNSIFDEKELEKEKGVVLEEISMSDDEYSDVCIDMLGEAYFGENSLAKTILGPRENVMKFTRSQIVDYIAQNYSSKSTVISIAGNIDFSSAKEMVAKYVEGKFPTVDKRDWADIAHLTTPTFLKKFKDIEQSNIAIGMPSINFSNKLDMPLMLVNNMVGGGMSSRLFQEIRENLGLAYNVYTYPSAYINNGVMSIYIGTNPKSVTKAISATAKVIDDIKKNGLSEREIERGIQQLKGSYVLGQESTSALMRVNAKYALFNNELFDIDKKLVEIDAITPAQVNEIIKECFDTTKASVTYVGKSVKENLLDVFNS